MPIAEQPPRGDDQPEPPIDLGALQREVAYGHKNINAAVGQLLRRESRIMWKALKNRQPGLNFDFVEGFSYVVSHLYPIVTDASILIERGQSFPEGAVEGVMDAPEDERIKFAAEVATNPLLQPRVNGNVIQSLEEEPTGAIWLEDQVNKMFIDSAQKRSRTGANEAILKAKEYFDFLNPLSRK